MLTLNDNNNFFFIIIVISVWANGLKKNHVNLKKNLPDMWA